MTAIEELHRWKVMEDEIKRLTSVSGWFMSQGLYWPQSVDLTLCQETCTFAELRQVADAIVSHFGRKDANFRITHQDPIGCTIGVANTDTGPRDSSD